MAKVACYPLASYSLESYPSLRQSHRAPLCFLGKSVRYSFPWLVTARSRRAVFSIRAQKEGGQLLSGASKVAGGAINAIVGVVPAAVPRPVAKTGVLVFGGLFVLSVVQKLLSFAFFIGVIGLAGFLALKFQKGASGSSNSASFDDEDGALAQAKRIMDKYK